jgi:DNA modification methylase
VTVTLHHGDALDVLRGLADNSVDAVVTDPPYGLSDHDAGDVAQALGCVSWRHSKHGPAVLDLGAEAGQDDDGAAGRRGAKGHPDPGPGALSQGR